MAKLTLTDITSGYALTTTVNANNALIEAAIENTISRDGTAPNTMNAALDMNSYAINNLPNAVANQQPITLAQAATIAGVTNPLTQESVATVLFPQTAAELAEAVTPTNYQYEEGDIRRYGAVDDAAIDGTSGTDSTTAIQTALDLAAAQGIVCRIPAGNYLITNLTANAATEVQGEGIHVSHLVSSTAATGTLFTDNGNAAKITLRDFTFYCNNASYTGGLNLGNGVTQVWGTEGYIDNIWVRDLPSGFPGIYIRGNVGDIGRIIAWETGGVAVVGPAMRVNRIVNLGASGFTESDTDTVTVGTELGDGQYTVVEVEAPDTGIIPLYIGKNSSIGSCQIAPTAGATYAHLIEVALNASTWTIGNLDLIFAAGTAPTITNGNIKDVTNGTYVGGNASGKDATGEGNYSSDQKIVDGVLELKDQRAQCFSVRMQNDSGTIKHRIGQPGNSAGAGSFHSKINGASTTLTATPTGADASTAMAAGAKIGSATTNLLHLDTNAQVAADAFLLATITYNSSTAAYTVIPAVTASTDINGTTQTRIGLYLQNATTGANVAWATALGTPGYIIDVNVMGYIA